MKILAIETSCDETSIAIIEASRSRGNTGFRACSHIISSQIKLHEKYGGVVPNLAKREHQKNLVPILIRALKKSHLYELGIMNYESRSGRKKIRNIEKLLDRERELFARIREYVVPIKKPPINAIAVTVGPGLEPALWVGINFAKALSILWDIPVIPVNHMEGHIFSALLQKRRKDNFQFSIFNFQKNSKFKILDSKFPVLALLVSGGHTELVFIKNFGKYKIVGETLDDAAGEAFDKAARLLGMAYPGGPALAKEAEKARRSSLKFPIFPSTHVTSSGSRAKSRGNFQFSKKFQNPNYKPQIKLPRPMMHSNDFNFSFSGLKTAVLYLIRDLQKAGVDIKTIRPLIAREFQNAAVETLVSKTIRAATRYKTKTILLAGGVAANKALREELARAAKKVGTECLVADPSLTGDNALMIAVAAFFNQKKATKKLSLLRADGRLRLA